jgi:hypothetical protein
MKRTVVLAAAFALAIGTGLQAADPVITGDYVEVRTAEVFTGGCIVGSEGETSGREAIMAWHVSRGALNGVPLDGLSIVAVVAGDRNLGTHELGGAAPTVVKSIVIVDERAQPAQQQALIAMAKGLAPKLLTDIIQINSLPVEFQKSDTSVQVSAGPAAVDVATRFRHSPECGAIQWFEPLAKTTGSEVGLTRSQSWSGSGLGAQWKQNDRKSSFVGTFAYTN